MRSVLITEIVNFEECHTSGRFWMRKQIRLFKLQFLYGQ